MKKNKIYFILISLLCVSNLFAAVDKHDFSNETWSNGKSCLICHSLENNLPKLSPPGSRVVDLTKLSALEQAAYDSNPKNAICLVCHTTPHSVIPIKINPTVPNTLPPAPSGGITSGSDSSVGIRVTNNGTNSLDCLQCHDLHNKDSAQMLKVDY